MLFHFQQSVALLVVFPKCLSLTLYFHVAMIVAYTPVFSVETEHVRHRASVLFTFVRLTFGVSTGVYKI